MDTPALRRFLVREKTRSSEWYLVLASNPVIAAELFVAALTEVGLKVALILVGEVDGSESPGLKRSLRHSGDLLYRVDESGGVILSEQSYAEWE